ncbi:MAG: hypothetical protein ACRDJ1_08305 [Actinomycetota bacterium]
MNLPRVLRALVASVVLVAAGAGCVGRSGGPGNGSFRATDVVGSVVARIPGAEARTLREGDDVPAGSILKTGPEQTNFVRLEGAAGRAVELQNDTQITLVDGRSVSLDLGRVLGQTGSEQPLRIESRGTGVELSVGGASRVERLLGALRVGVYQGSARLELLGRGVDIPRFRELVIAGGVPLEREARPLTLSATDRWDRRLLGDVLDFNRELEQFGTGFNSEFGSRPIAPRFFASFVTLPSVGFLRAQLPTDQPAEILVGVVFAQQLSAKAADPLQLPQFFTQLNDLREQGATWGLIAKEMGLDLRLALQGVRDAIVRGTAPPATSGTGGGSGGGGSGGGGGGGGGGSKPGPEPSPTPTDDPTEPPPEEPPPGGDCSLLEMLLGQCSEAAGTTGSAAAEECSVVDSLLDPNC